MIRRKKKKRAEATSMLPIIPENIPEEVKNVPHEMQMQAIKLAQKGMGDLQIIEYFKSKGAYRDRGRGCSRRSKNLPRQTI